MSSGRNLNDKILNSEDLGITEEQKQEAIKKEEYFRKLYYSIYDLNSTKDFKSLASELVLGFEKMLDEYADTSKNQNEINYIIKFAFRDFFLIIFINMKNFFDNNEFLKELHKKVYFSNSYVTIAEFEELINYCKEYIKSNG